MFIISTNIHMDKKNKNNQNQKKDSNLHHVDDPQPSFDTETLPASDGRQSKKEKMKYMIALAFEANTMPSPEQYTDEWFYEITGKSYIYIYIYVLSV